GAHDGAGLGLQFLRHVERTKLLIHLIDISSVSGRDPVEDYRVIRNELESYKTDLREKPEIVVANKIDALDEPDRLERLRAFCKERDLAFFEISAVTGEGIKPLINAVAHKLESVKSEHGDREDRNSAHAATGQGSMVDGRKSTG